jgi:hypothetical protein
MAVQLLVYGFGAESDFSGQLVGALERLESGGALRIADALFVQSDAETRELAAVDLQGRRMDAMVATLLEFRLDPGKRRRTTDRALAGDAIRELADALEPGTGLVAILVKHVWAEALDDAVARTGGTALHGDFVDASDLADLTDELVSAARGLASTNT